MSASKSSPSWSDFKAGLADLARGELIKLIQGLYAASRENKVFLHTRFGLERDPLDQPSGSQAPSLGQQGQEGDFGLQEGIRSARGAG